MNSYKRHVYKTKNPPKPPRIIVSLSWFRSRGWAASDIECIPINIAFFKDSMNTALVVGESVFVESSLTTPLANGSYSYSNTMFENNTTGTVNYMNVQNGVVVELLTAECIEETFSPIQITKMWKGAEAACTATELLTFYINDNNIISSDIDTPAQLFLDDNGDTPIDPSTDVGLGEAGSPGNTVKYILGGTSRLAILDTQGRLTTPLGICNV